MDTLKRETRWSLHIPTMGITQSEVYLDENGKIVTYRDIDDSDFYDPDNNNEIFFMTKEEAEKAREEYIPKNREQVKKYIEYLFDYGNFEKLQEWLPENVFRLVKKASENYFFRTRLEREQIQEAIRGIIHIKSYAFQASEISHIYLDSDTAKVKLRDGTIIQTDKRNDIFILQSIFA